ncbi:Ypt/Rab-GAP domain of gyp1p superfamily protein [Trifolium repens]|nr:Ypt/Rab-GAP domain of gyp1p superfamily protein [Trifolium repens]
MVVDLNTQKSFGWYWLLNLKRILNCFYLLSFYNFDLGYCQGMSDLLSPILFVMEDESEAFWCFVALMERLGPNFNRDQNGMHSQLFALSKIELSVAESGIDTLIYYGHDYYEMESLYELSPIDMSLLTVWFSCILNVQIENVTSFLAVAASTYLSNVKVHMRVSSNDNQLLNFAEDLAKRSLPAFDTLTGIT